MTPAIRVLFRDMPPLLRGVLETAVSGHADMQLIKTDGTGGRATSDAAIPDVVLIGEQESAADGNVATLLLRWPRCVIVEIETSGRGVRMHELKPQETEFGEMSPRELVDTICTVVRCRGARLHA